MCNSLPPAHDPACSVAYIAVHPATKGAHLIACIASIINAVALNRLLGPFGPLLPPGHCLSSLAIFKRSPFIDASRHLHSQLQVVTLPGWYQSDASQDSPSNANQNVEIPEIHQTQSSNAPLRNAEKPRLVLQSSQAVGDISDDSTFLNKLQSGVNGWIKESKK
ncbi:hypothetical protein BJ741DRAFT_707441 [Chytriomyces cf. hyalinus JEL632]|nr:hypothetical protein BJ741DRAFT_707441 [Chytriomyces cf. hyalinus JEL632]